MMPRISQTSFNERNIGESQNSTINVLALLSRLMKDWGRYTESLSYDTKLYELSLSKYGEQDERVADAARQLARTHYLSGKYQLAIGYYAQNLTIRKLLYGDQHPQTAVALNCLGMANKVLGNYEEGKQDCNLSNFLTINADLVLILISLYSYKVL